MDVSHSENGYIRGKAHSVVNVARERCCVGIAAMVLGLALSYANTFLGRETYDESCQLLCMGGELSMSEGRLE